MAVIDGGAIREIQGVLGAEFASEEECFEGVYAACCERQWQVIEQASEAVAEVRDVAGRTLVIRAIDEGDDGIVTDLLARNVFKLFFVKDREDNTPLHAVAWKGGVEMLRKLDIVPKDLNAAGNPYFYYAILYGHHKFLKEVVKKWGIPQQNVVHEGQAMPPVLFAIARGDQKCVDALWSDESVRMSMEVVGGPLHVAIRYNQMKMLVYLLGKCRRDVIEHKNGDGQTPFCFAAAEGNRRALTILKAYGAVLAATDQSGKTAVHHAAIHFRIDALRILAYFGLEMHALDGDFLHAYAHIRELQTPIARATGAVWCSLYRERTRAVHAVPNFNEMSPEGFVFQGGGPKGIAFCGVYGILEKRGLLKALQRVAGTSAGALTAIMIGLNFKSNEINQILFDLNLMDFIDDPVTGTWERFKNAALFAKLKLGLGALRKIQTAVTNPASFVMDALQTLWKCNGVCEGNKLRAWIEDQIEKRTGDRLCTFGEFAEHVRRGSKGFKHIHVFVTKLGDRPAIVRISSEDPRWKGFIMADVFTATASIPGVFKPRHLCMKIDGRRVEQKELGHYCDGGLLMNFPVEVFDFEQFQSVDALSDVEKKRPKFNPRTLGFSLSPTHEKPLEEKSVGNIGALLKGIMAAYFDAESLIRETVEYNETRIVRVDPKGVGTLSFNLKDDGKRMLLDSGEQAIVEFLDKEKAEEFEGMFLANAGSNGVYLLAECANDECEINGEESWTNLGLGKFDVAEACAKAKCPSCQTHYRDDKVETIAIRGTKYKWSGRKADSTSVYEGKTRDGQAQKSHKIFYKLSDWRFISVEVIK